MSQGPFLKRARTSRRPFEESSNLQPAQARPVPGPPLAGPPVESATEAVGGINTIYMKEFETMLTEIVTHPTMAGIENAPAKTLADGGAQSPFSMDELNFAMSPTGTGSYTAGNNLFKHNLRKLPVAGVPINKKAIIKNVTATRNALTSTRMRLRTQSSES